MKFTLPELPYSYDALEPFIDAKTIEIHHSKHHQTYVAKLNEALEKHPEFGEKPLFELLRALEAVPADIRTAVRNHGGGHFNHSLFWKAMKPQSRGGGGEPKGVLGKAVEESFGDFAKFRDEFSKAAAGLFGSGWAWLARGASGKLSIAATSNQDNPAMKGERIVLGLDVWEHAYYLKYQNRRPEYVEAWWNIVDWDEATQRFEKTEEE